MKSKLAFQFSVANFSGRFVFLWTFTFKRALNVKDARRLWSSANNRFRKAGLLAGLRAFEMHPGGHGLHVHMVTETFTSVDRVRAVWEGAATDYEGGRIHVARVPVEEAGYIGKYLAKKRPECLAGARLWAAVGGFPASKVKDIVRDCALTRAYSLCVASVCGFRGMTFWRRMALTRLTMGNLLRQEIGATLLPSIQL